MKKISFAALAIIFSLSVNQALALDLDKIAKEVDSHSAQKQNGKKGGSVLDGALGNVADKLEEKVDKITEKLEKRLDKYEEKIEKAEKATDKIVSMVNNFDLAKYVGMIKIALFVLAGVFAIFIVMLFLVYMQLSKIKKKLMSATIKF